MARTKIDWGGHIAAYRSGDLSVKAYCEAAGLNPGTLKFHLYKKSKSKRLQAFQELPVSSDLVITRTSDGELWLRGFDLTHISPLVGAWSDALSQ